MAEYVPYFDGMKLGQGYNTYVQQTCVEDAVTITPQKPGGDGGVQKSYSSVLIEDYDQLTRSLQISGAAAISGWGVNLEIDTTFLNRTEFETSDITYQVLVQGKNQADASSKAEFNWYEASNPHETYGDRYIADFITGGTFFARVSMKVRKKHIIEDIKASAKLAFSCFMVGGSVTAEVESAMKTIGQYSDTSIIMHSEGSGNYTRDTPADLLDLKRRADEFYDHMSEQSYRRFALLGQYGKLPNFKNHFKPLNYSYATQKSWEIFDSFSRYLFFKDLIERIPIEKFVNGGETRRDLLNFRIDEMAKIQAKVLSVKADPAVVNQPGQFEDADSFRLRILNGVKAVELHFASNVDPVHSDRTLNKFYEHRSEIPNYLLLRFSLKVFDFSAILGTTLVSFGVEQELFGSTATSGEHISDWESGFTEERYFWAFFSRGGGQDDGILVDVLYPNLEISLLSSRVDRSSSDQNHKGMSNLDAPIFIQSRGNVPLDWYKRKFCFYSHSVS
ncbi:uncharacterized protein LAJ45_11318 [Morchella importuna]|uniref:MACPF domain-containing protein n=1 Tax=Morchella conica CCBAS932 TaxID=1392247 RepID=A0A3N4KDH2_9PEZI|nr:uncharacterized protein LAJ45_11318 [Morchella importuna]KAH8144657.1 hypothetical protein LAJ45_11318 [Morchella importuna]RPB07382.1 hypothetical protein P167DRAFT_579327 [Morchella conica CCBAS932]